MKSDSVPAGEGGDLLIKFFDHSVLEDCFGLLANLESSLGRHVSLLASLSASALSPALLREQSPLSLPSHCVLAQKIEHRPLAQQPSDAGLVARRGEVRVILCSVHLRKVRLAAWCLCDL